MKFLLALFMVCTVDGTNAHDFRSITEKRNFLFFLRSLENRNTLTKLCQIIVGTCIRTRILRRISMNLRLSRWKCWTTISLCTHATPIDFQLSRMYYDISSMLPSSSSMMIVLGICFCSLTTAAIFRFVITVIRLIRPVLLFLPMLNEANHSHDPQIG